MVRYGIGSDRLVCGGESRIENRDGGEMETYSSASKHAADIHLYMRQPPACAAGEESNKAEIINLFHASKSQQPSGLEAGAKGLGADSLDGIVDWRQRLNYDRGCFRRTVWQGSVGNDDSNENLTWKRIGKTAYSLGPPSWYKNMALQDNNERNHTLSYIQSPQNII